MPNGQIAGRAGIDADREQHHLAAIRYVHANIQLGMQTADVAKLTARATVALGGGYDFSLSLLNEASAFPHGSKVVQTVA